MNSLSSDSFFSGLSGLQLDIPKYLFPEPFKNASRLSYYSSLFNSIEINSSFYKIPQPATVAKWTASVGDHFKFTFKLWKEITHNRNMIFNEPDVVSFLKSIKPAKEKLGCLLIQLPPGTGNENISRLEKLLRSIREIEVDLKLAVEFRNKKWYTDSTYDLINFYKAALVIHDIPRSATPLINHPSDFIYVRFHGPTGNYRDSYSRDFLSEYATYVNEWLEEDKEVYMYFNNTMGDAFSNLKIINGFVNKTNVVQDRY